MGIKRILPAACIFLRIEISRPSNLPQAKSPLFTRPQWKTLLDVTPV